MNGVSEMPVDGEVHTLKARVKELEALVLPQPTEEERDAIEGLDNLELVTALRSERLRAKEYMRTVNQCYALMRAVAPVLLSHDHPEVREVGAFFGNLKDEE